MQFDNIWYFIADVKSSKRKGARSFFNMLVAFAGAAMYVKAIFESVNTWRKVVVKQSWNADGMLRVVYKTFIFNSANIIRHWRKADLSLVISSCYYGFVVWRVNVDCHIFLSWLLYSNVLSQKIQTKHWGASYYIKTLVWISSLKFLTTQNFQMPCCDQIAWKLWVPYLPSTEMFHYDKT